MTKKFKVLYYVNQFFGQIGGEEKAGIAPTFEAKTIGPALGFNGLLGDEGEVVGTIICGDNYFNENKEEALEYIMNVIKEQNPDIVVAGPAFNAGRYGMACAGVANAVIDELNIPVVTGMYIENPGLDECKSKAYVVSVADSAGGMRKALPLMASLTKKLAKGEEIGLPEEEGYIPQGKRLTVFSDKRGSQRAVEYFYTTTGTGTSVGNSTKFGTEIGRELKEAGVDGVILTSTWGTCTRCGATMVKEIERYGIPIVHMSTITTISESVGANRIVPTIAIPHPVGNPNLPKNEEYSLRKKMVERAIDALAIEITEVTEF